MRLPHTLPLESLPAGTDPSTISDLLLASGPQREASLAESQGDIKWNWRRSSGLAPGSGPSYRGSPGTLPPPALPATSQSSPAWQPEPPQEEGGLPRGCSLPAGTELKCRGDRTGPLGRQTCVGPLALSCLLTLGAGVRLAGHGTGKWQTLGSSPDLLNSKPGALFPITAILQHQSPCITAYFPKPQFPCQ